MKRDDISDALNLLDDDILEETNQVRQNPKGRTYFFRKYQSLAAGLALVLLLGSVVGGYLWLKPFLNTTDSDSATEFLGVTDTDGSDRSGNESANYGSKEETATFETYALSQNQTFLTSQMNFALELFQTSAKNSAYKNVLVSPFSMMQALSMTANGADGKTQTEMLQVLADGFTLEQLNETLQIYSQSLPNAIQYELQLANSIWIREDADFTVNENFLNTSQNYYDAQIFTEVFSNQTLNNINNWVKENTNDHIPKILDKIDSDTVMYLINALAFDAEWDEPYSKSDISTGEFVSENGSVQDTEMMHATEYYYLDDGNATGFIKNYKDGTYRFAALLPNEDISISQYIQSLSSDQLAATLGNAEKTAVNTAMPKFSYDYELEMNSVLQEMGMTTAFHSDKADFSNLGSSKTGNLYIGKVLHKTFISVDEAGTQAGAATSVEIKEECAIMYPKEVILNRPFVYMILDGTTNLPIFIGTVTNLSH